MIINVQHIVECTGNKVNLLCVQLIASSFSYPYTVVATVMCINKTRYFEFHISAARLLSLLRSQFRTFTELLLYCTVLVCTVYLCNSVLYIGQCLQQMYSYYLMIVRRNTCEIIVRANLWAHECNRCHFYVFEGVFIDYAILYFEYKAQCSTLHRTVYAMLKRELSLMSLCYDCLQAPIGRCGRVQQLAPMLEGAEPHRTHDSKTLIYTFYS